MSQSATTPLICQICKKHKSPHDDIVAEMIRPSLLEFIKKEKPDLNSKGFICFDDLGEFRKDYVKEVLQDEIGELSAFFFSGRRRHTRCGRDWSSDVCSSD